MDTKNHQHPHLFNSTSGPLCIHCDKVRNDEIHNLMDTKTFIDGQACEVFVEDTGDNIPFAYSEEKHKWEMQDAAYGVASRYPGYAYDRFCRVLVSQLNEGKTSGNVGILAWNIC